MFHPEPGLSKNRYTREREREISRRISQNQTFFSERGHQVDETSAKADGDHIVVHWKIED